ncbi:unnamed protein product [Prorocentrum cordatum]|uniref:Uncharacterized protein n=1 Tax=Prorocentrum cordatum TaxID=2364126 RepID=A0ABN9UZ91_9DINO|nr:unnamed protein product [Polarella glacialis]
MPRFTRQPSATKNKIKAPAKTAINPHGSVVAVVLDVSELVPVSVVIVAVLVVCLTSRNSCPYRWSSWPSWWSSRWSSQLLPHRTRTRSLNLCPGRRHIGPHHHAGPVGAHGHRGTEVVGGGPITRHKLQQPLAGGPVEHVRGARIGALVVVKFAPHHHAGPVGAHGHRGTETVVSSPITRHKLQQPLAGGPLTATEEPK